ncbi:FimV/HubP family polar landmark protein [Neisseria chenwenguii]|uniref:TspA protein n=1 Tax=Neisseria chenwenguii TaxID=1853278 RepID=A0A220S324_9NEIS|nr:FimV/HubP family polar landmark protein [Neisseria chenwenguii]ASK27595.1 TspA protein [Neisseria chenwenguii]ROV55518.1 TspA protein [Neisseria chenwenguii]
MKSHHKIKLIAASIALTASFGATAGLGGLNVRSNLGEPFSGSITVTGDEARALLNGGKASVSGNGLYTSVRKSGNNAIVNIRSSRPIQDPVLIFQVGVGSQSREYTAIIDPADYNGKSDGSTRRATRVENTADNNTDTAAPDTRSARTENARKAENRQQQKPRQPGRIVYGQRHLVQEGETLIGIATKIRPQGMTVVQTIHALVNANPKVFVNNNADFMLAGKVLNIPTGNELKRLAGRPSSMRIPAETMAQAQTPSAGASATQAQAVAQPKAEPQAPVQTQTGPTASTGNTASKTQPAAQTQAASAPAQTAAASAPAAAASEAPASMPSETAVTASPAASSAASVPAAEQSESGMWRWLLIGGGALIGLFVLSKILGNRKKDEPEAFAAEPKSATLVDEDEDEINVMPAEHESAFSGNSAFTDSKPTSAAAIGAATMAVATAAAAVAAKTAQTKKEDDSLTVEDDFNDDIFFNNIRTEPTGKQDDIRVDLNTLDTTQGDILSSAVTHDEETEKRRNLDWDTVESTESVYEPEPENQYARFDAVSTPVQTASTLFDEKAEAAETAAMPSETQAPASVEDSSWNFRDDQAAEAAAPAPADEPLEFTPFADAGPAAVETPAVDAEPEAVSIETFEAATPATAFAASDSLEAEIEKAETAFEAESEPFATQPSSTFALSDSDTFDGQPLQTAQLDETIEWDDLDVGNADSSGSSDAGFISESVGMTAPLEAKYELAKMYVEIGDPQAARETLQELLEESEGDISAKAKSLLNEINA